MILGLLFLPIGGILMIIKKAGGQIYGAVLTAAERKAMNIEIGKQLAEFDKKHEIEINALILWLLHDQFGFGHDRLRKFFKGFDKGLDELTQRYELDRSDDIWLSTLKLKEYGIDLEEWIREYEASKKNG